MNATALPGDGARVQVPLPPETVCTDLRYLRPLSGEAHL